MKKKYIIPAIEVEMSDLEDFLALSLEDTRKATDTEVLSREGANEDAWGFDFGYDNNYEDNE